MKQIRATDYMYQMHGIPTFTMSGGKMVQVTPTEKEEKSEDLKQNTESENDLEMDS